MKVAVLIIISFYLPLLCCSQCIHCGEYKFENGEMSYTYQFNSDSSYKSLYRQGWCLIIEEAGKWETKSDTLITKYWIDGNKTTSMKKFLISKDGIVIIDGLQSGRILKKVE